METLTVTEVLPSKQNKAGDTYWPVKANGHTYNLDQEAAVGDQLQCDVRESNYTYQGKQVTTRWAQVKGKVSVQSDNGASNGKSNGRMNQFVMAQAVDFWWQTVKAFEMADEGKASVLCTLLIATADGRINYELPPELPDEENPFA